MKFQLDAGRLAALLRKELRQILRDPATLLIAGVLPLILIFLFGYAVSLDTSRTRIGVVLQDSGMAATSLAQAFASSRWFDVTLTRDIEPLRRKLVDEQVRGIVVIPQDFPRRPTQVITDGSLPQTANFVAAYAQGLQASWAASEGLDPRLAGRPAMRLEPRVWFNPELRSRYFLVPGAIAIVMTMVGTLLTALVVAREWERGTMEALLATPVRMGEFLASKLVPYFVLALGSMTACTLIGVFVFGVPFRGSPLGLFALASAFLVPALGQGLLISATTKNQFVASQLALLSAFLPSFLLSGFLFEISSMPLPIRLLTYLVPARYLVPELQTVFMAGDDWPRFLQAMGILLLFGALFAALTFRATTRRIA